MLAIAIRGWGMKFDEKRCPQCAETIKVDALICRHCHYRFDPDQVKAEIARNRKYAAGGCAGLIVVVLVISAVFGAGESASSGDSEALSAEEVSAAVTPSTPASRRRKPKPNRPRPNKPKPHAKRKRASERSGARF